MKNTSPPLSGHSQMSICPKSAEVIIEWTDGSETLSFNHSFSRQSFFYHRIEVSNQALLKACSNKQRNIQRILDMTGGWGIDSFILAQHGKQVTMLEQNSLVHSVVAQSLLDAKDQSHTSSAAKRIELIHDNSIDYLSNLGTEKSFDCIYLDPMFPAHKSSAKPAKEMQLLQKLTENINLDNCLELALQRAKKRVVVKRPVKSSPLENKKPDITYREKTIRFDVYLTAT